MKAYRNAYTRLPEDTVLSGSVSTVNTVTVIDSEIAKSRILKALTMRHSQVMWLLNASRIQASNVLTAAIETKLVGEKIGEQVPVKIHSI